jgi:hypothetical protein
LGRSKRTSAGEIRGQAKSAFIYQEIKGEKDLNFTLRTQKFTLQTYYKEVYPMLTDKDLGIKKLILERIMQINDEIIESDPEYKKLEERPNELLRLMAAKLTPEDKEHLMKEYDNTYYGPICRREELIYSAALMDGMSIGYWVALVARGVEKIKV